MTNQTYYERAPQPKGTPQKEVGGRDKRKKEAKPKYTYWPNLPKPPIDRRKSGGTAGATTVRGKEPTLGTSTWGASRGMGLPQRAQIKKGQGKEKTGAETKVGHTFGGSAEGDHGKDAQGKKSREIRKKGEKKKSKGSGRSKAARGSASVKRKKSFDVQKKEANGRGERRKTMRKPGEDKKADPARTRLAVHKREKNAGQAAGRKKG